MAAKTLGTAATTRQRKVSCPDCGYTVRMARSWMQVGLPVCPCGEEMRPDSPADLALCGLIGQSDVPVAMWTAICRENGWGDCIVRKGAAYKAHVASGRGHLDSRRVGAAHCVYRGCQRWIANGAERCAAGHPQHKEMSAVEGCPFLRTVPKI
jgi:hypothetical protein